MALLKNAGITGSATGGLLLLLFLVRGGLSGPTYRAESRGGQTHSSGEKAGTSGSAKAKNKKWPEEGPWKASRQYFAGIQPAQDQSQKSQSQNPLAGKQMDDPCPSLKPDPGKKAVAAFGNLALTLEQSDDGVAIVKGKEHDQLWCIIPGTSAAAMIAIVPDPVHSHFALFFDRAVEALQLSGESMGYEMDRYWLPWQPETPASASTQANAEDRSEKEEQPGLMMFRWNGPTDASDQRPRVLYIFLVSEISTAGMDGTQFRNAIQYIQQVCKTSDGRNVCPTGNVVKMMGPTFSGSLASLRSLTKVWQDLKFSVYSGTVSSVCAVDDQDIFSQTSLKKEGFSPDCINKESKVSPLASSLALPTPTPNLTFSSMVGDSETAVREFIEVLRYKGAIQCYKNAPAQVAILSEAATTYGNTTGTMTAKKPEDDCSHTDFRYPREISSLRNASASSDPPVVASQQTGVSDGPTYLPFTLADQQPNFGDEPPDFSQTQGPLSKEAVLMKYAADLRRGRYKMVGIIGSNVLDVLFLAKFLRSACPDVRLFVINNSDLLFERDLDNAPYIGTLSVGTYPLIGRTLDWIAPSPSPSPTPIPSASSSPTLKLPGQLPFSNQYEEGQYNASMLAMREALASEGGTLMEVGRPFTESSGDFHPNSSVLPLWLTVVGTGGYWPVEIMPPTAPAKNAKDTSLLLEEQDFCSAWWVVTLVLAIIGFLQSWLLVTVKPDAMRFHDFSMINASSSQRFFFINVISASLAFTLALFIVPALKYGRHSFDHVCGISVAGLCTICALFWACCYLVPAFPRNSGAHSREKRNYLLSIISSVFIWVLVVIGVSAWLSLIEDSSSHYGFFFSYRSVNLATGVSPLTPILVIFFALYLWGVFEIWRLRFDDQVRPRLNLSCDFPGGAQEEKIAGSINNFLLNNNYRLIFGIVYFAWFISLHPWCPFNLVEAPAFGRLYEIIFCLVVALTLSSGLRLSQTWGHLHKLLLELERSRIRPAFSRLKGASWSSIWNAGGQDEEWASLAQSFEVMEEIRGNPALDQNIDFAAKTRADIHLSHCKEKKDFPKLEALFSTLQNSLATVLNDVMTVLYASKQIGLLQDDQFDHEGKPVIVNCIEKEPDAELKNLQRMQEYAALRYVAFIRSTVGHLRQWLILQAIVFSLALLSLNVYSFEPHRSLIWAFSAIFVLIGIFATGFLLQVDRNHVISRITGTKPNELGTSFYIRIATLGAVPLLTLLATQFPAIGHYLLSFIQPGMEALK